MLRWMVAVVLVASACSAAGEGDTETTLPVQSTTLAPPDTPVPPSTTTLPTIESCDNVPYRPLEIPGRAEGSQTDSADLGDDPYTTIPGTAIKLWVDGNSSPVMALIRGTLPPEPWAGPTARVEILRQDAALGPLPGDRWAVAWFESEDRCDLYTLLLYPPTSAEEALTVADSLVPDR